MPSDSTHAIWVDPLEFDALVNGPPYLPERVRMAMAKNASDGVLLQAMQGFEGLPLAELGALVGILRAASLVHQTHHWQTRGGNFYGDHQMFMRIYDDSQDFIDQVAERAIGAGSRDLVNPLVQAALIPQLVSAWGVAQDATSFDMVSISLVVERCVLDCLKAARARLEASGQLSDGTDNLLQGVSDKHEEFVYLLQQRQGGRVASYSYRREASDTASLRKLQAAYNVAKDIVSGSVDVELSDRTKNMARTYFNLVDRHGTNTQRSHAGEALSDQLDAEAQSAKIAVKMLDHWSEVFREATGIYHNEALGE